MKQNLEIVNIEAFKKAWATIQRRAKKLGLTIPTATPIGKVYMKDCEKVIISQYEQDKTYKCAVECQLWEVDRISYSFAGWSLVAVAEPLQGSANLLIPINENSRNWADASISHSKSGQVCEHCNKIRNRSKVFVLGRSDDFTKTVQVGSSCLADFCDSNSANISSVFEFESTIYEMLQEFGWEKGSQRESSQVTVLSPIKVLEKACEASLASGYISRSKAEQLGVCSTADTVKISFDSKAKLKDQIVPSEIAIARAKVILDWALIEAAEKEDTESYWNGVAQLLEFGFVPLKRLGYIVGLVGCHAAHMRKLEQNSETSASEFQGTIGIRQNFEATVTRVSNFDTQYGVGTLTMMKTSDGHILKYWNYVGETGNKVQFSANIKAHEDDQFVKAKVTVLSRATKIKQLQTA